MNTQESAESTAPLCRWGWAFITMLPAGRWLIQRLHHLLLTGTSWNQPWMHPEMSEAKLQLSSRCLGLVHGSQLLLCSTKPSAQKLVWCPWLKMRRRNMVNCTTAPQPQWPGSLTRASPITANDSAISLYSSYWVLSVFERKISLILGCPFH